MRAEFKALVAELGSYPRSVGAMEKVGEASGGGHGAIRLESTTWGRKEG